MSRYLVVTWDGAGNLVWTLGIAQRLAQRGHDVRLLGHRSIDERCGAHGWRFRPFEHTVDFDSTQVTDVAAEFEVLARSLWFNGAVGDDVRDELDRETADVVLVDAMLAAGLSAGQAANVPTVALFHSPFSGFRGGPMVDMLAPAVPAVNAARAQMGLGPVNGLAAIHDACSLSLVATPREFEVDMPMPANVRFVGPILDGPPLLTGDDDVAVVDGPEPLVVVSFSTSYQAQLPVLQLVVDALAELAIRVVVTTGPSLPVEAVTPRGNTAVARFIGHDRLLAHASLVVTHAGLGTVMTALSQGVPLLCLPLGRDQFFNAAQVEQLGAGHMLHPGADGAAITGAVRELLDSPTARDGAKRAAGIIARYGGTADAVDELERLAQTREVAT